MQAARKKRYGSPTSAGKRPPCDWEKGPPTAMGVLRTDAQEGSPVYPRSGRQICPQPTPSNLALWPSVGPQKVLGGVPVKNGDRRGEPS